MAEPIDPIALKILKKINDSTFERSAIRVIPTKTQGIGITLPLRLGNTGYFEQSFDTLTQVKSNFINLILTRKGERVYQPTFGCSIHDYLFDQLTPENIEAARVSVIQAVEQWMPFLELVTFELIATSEELDNNKLQLYVGYRLRKNPNIRDTIILTF